MNISAGWIKLHRRFLEWEWFKTPHMARVFIYMLLRASHKETSYMGQRILPGQFITGRKALADATGLTEQQVRTCIKRLISTNEITTQPTNHYSLVTISNYAIYQGLEDDEQPEEQPTEQPTTNQQLTNNQPTTNHIQEVKEIKECKELKKDTDRFHLTWNGINLDFVKITATQWINLKKKYSTDDILKTAAALQNYSKRSKYKDHYLTLLNWLGRDCEQIQQPEPVEMPEHAKQLRREHAEKMAESGSWERAAELYREIGDDKNADYMLMKASAK